MDWLGPLAFSKVILAWTIEFVPSWMKASPLEKHNWSTQGGNVSWINWDFCYVGSQVRGLASVDSSTIRYSSLFLLHVFIYSILLLWLGVLLSWTAHINENTWVKQNLCQGYNAVEITTKFRVHIQCLWIFFPPTNSQGQKLKQFFYSCI